MPTNPQEFADLFGAKLIGEVPDAGGGPFGMARLAHLMHQRLTPSQGERPGRPTDSIWESRPKVPMSEATRRRLVEIAEAMTTPQRSVSPMQVAAQLLEEAVSRVQLKAEVRVEANASDTGETVMPMRETEDASQDVATPSEGTRIEPGLETKVRDAPGVPTSQAAPTRKKGRRLKTNQDQGQAKVRHRQRQA